MSSTAPMPVLRDDPAACASPAALLAGAESALAAIERAIPSLKGEDAAARLRAFNRCATVLRELIATVSPMWFAAAAAATAESQRLAEALARAEAENEALRRQLGARRRRGTGQRRSPLLNVVRGG